MERALIFPILLAAGRSDRLKFPQALARFGRKTALQIALENCSGLQRPIVVLGAQAGRIRPAVPRHAQVVINRRWRSGQLSSLLAGLRRVPRNAAVLVYPVDHPLLTPSLIRRLVIAFERRTDGEGIVLPRFGGRAGHPTIFASEIRVELERARTAREVVYRNKSRIKYVKVRTTAIWEDFNSRESYERCAKRYRARVR